MSDLNEEIVSSTEVFAGRLLKVKLEEVLLSDGTRARREIVYHRGAVAVVPFSQPDRVLLVRQFRLAAGKPLLEIPAGTLDAGESPEACARRELAEETGFRPGRLERLCAMYVAPGYSSELIHLFLADQLEPAWAQADADERLELVEVSLADALEMAAREEIQDAKTMVGLLWAARKRATG